MNTYADLEDSVVERLGPLVTEWLTVVPMPETQAAFARPAGKSVRITVSANQTEAEGQLDTWAGHQDANNTVAIIIQANALRGPRGIYTIEQAVRWLLVGFTPANHQTSFRYVRGRFIEPEFVDGVWTWQMDLTTRGVIVQEYDENAGEVLITQITTSTDLETDTVTEMEEIDGGYPDSIFEDEYDGGTP